MDDSCPYVDMRYVLNTMQHARRHLNRVITIHRHYIQLIDNLMLLTLGSELVRRDRLFLSLLSFRL